MTDKFHCKLLYDEDDDLDEYADYYNFDLPDPDMAVSPASGEGAAGGVLGAAAAGGGGKAAAAGGAGGGGAPEEEMHISPTTGELVLGNGRIVGHRSMKFAYQQNVRGGEDQRPMVQAAKKQQLQRLITQYGSEGMGSGRTGQQLSTFVQKKRCVRRRREGAGGRGRAEMGVHMSLCACGVCT